MIIYCLTNKINGKSYIGQTRRSIYDRLKDHKLSKYLIGKAIRKYGIKNFSIKILHQFRKFIGIFESKELVMKFWKELFYANN